MNKQRRKSLDEASRLLSVSTDGVLSVLQEERFCMSNYPENLQGSNAYLDIEANVDRLEDAIDSMRDAIRCIEGVI